jgi:hypothetical protein
MGESMNVQINIVPPSEMRYATVGDWQHHVKNGKQTLVITVADTGDSGSNMLVAIHELVEATLCDQNGVTEAQVDKWDKDHADADEPGEVKGAPYFAEHHIATSVEMMLAPHYDLNWAEHERHVEDVSDAVDEALSLKRENGR